MKDQTPSRHLGGEDKDDKQGMRTWGFFAGLVSKALLEAGGCEVDYRINGEKIEHIEKLHEFDISERLKLAIQEERFEDCVALKKLLQQKRNGK